MKRIITLLVILFLSNTMTCQIVKNIIYVNENNQTLTLEEYQSIKQNDVFIKEIDNGTSLIKQVLLRNNHGILDSIEHKQIKLFLSKIIGPEFDEHKNTIIHLYQKNNELVIEGIKNKKYWSWIRKNSKRYQSFLIGTKASKITEDINSHLYIDSYNLIKKLFFSNSDFQINHLNIRPNGEFYTYIGNRDILEILDKSVF